ncbi:MAG TPA: 16S rRNA (adenine(1518)-N(6)/adenine(1519)-N(6))-dimethyltransferase RsmA [Levilinea sp.]|nr:16S rRNA (adenine(1518)-N(6)/adenine(1519)-N(6))-dimethyltransferase RsmA [Levilinea sp.]
MNLSPLEIGALLRAHRLQPKKGLGQNFLADPVALERIVKAAEIMPEAHVLEIGPGLGSLTRYLARAARWVTAVELDQALLPVLQEVLAPFNNVRIVPGDILKLDPAGLVPESGYLVVANIPYYITSAVIRHLLETPVKPARIVLTVQREVAERITAAPGKLSLLALSVQVYGLPSIAARIPAGAFYPPPKVDSAVVRVDLYPQPQIPRKQLKTFFRLAKAGFGQKRKMLRNALAGGLGHQHNQIEELLRTAGIDPQRRAETLSMDEWRMLTEEFVRE